MNKVLKNVQETKDMGLQYEPLGLKSMQLDVVIDIGYNTKYNRTSELGMAVLLVDESNRCHFPPWTSTKNHSVTKSMLAGAVYAFLQEYYYGVST